MRVVLLLALIGFATPSAQAGVQDWWRHFCERHLVTEDPYQWDDMPTEWIINEYRATGGKMRWRSTLDGEYHLRALSISLKWRWHFVSDEEKLAINQALEDYPLKVPAR